jgi:hypothetical protein
MEIRSTPPARYFHATTGGAGVDPEHRCGHGTPSIVLHLISGHGDSAEELGVLLPACLAPDIFGAVMATLAAAGGPAAAEEFIQKMFAAYEQAVHTIAARTSACCEAGYRTAGREHTCGRSSATPTA